MSVGAGGGATEVEVEEEECESRGVSGSYCVALYDFEPERSDEVSLRAGARVRILRQRSADWWEGELDGQVGLFPTNYVALTTQ